MEKCPSISAVVYTRDNIQPEGSGNKMVRKPFETYFVTDQKFDVLENKDLLIKF